MLSIFPSVPSTPQSSISAFTVTKLKNSTRLVTFHWRKQPDDERNGPNFLYVIDPSERTTKHYSEKLVLESENNVFNIGAVNGVGYSNDKFEIVVPNEDDRQKLSEISESILVDNHGQFTILWNYSDKLPSNSIVTVFWCSKSRDSNCANGVEWKELSKDATKFEIPAEEEFINYAFTSISVNNITRGMKIVPCRLSIGNKSIIKGYV